MIESVDPSSCGASRQSERRSRRSQPNILGCLAFALLAILAATFAVPGLAEFATGLAPGDTAMSGFSGATLSLESLPPGVAPIDKTVIDPAGSSVSILSLSTLGGVPQGRTIAPGVKLSIKAKDIGQVFPLAFDDGKDGQPANLYAGATSAYGLNIVSAKPDADGSPVRLKVGAPDAQFMPGQ